MTQNYFCFMIDLQLNALLHFNFNFQVCRWASKHDGLTHVHWFTFWCFERDERPNNLGSIDPKLKRLFQRFLARTRLGPSRAGHFSSPGCRENVETWRPDHPRERPDASANVRRVVQDSGGVGRTGNAAVGRSGDAGRSFGWLVGLGIRVEAVDHRLAEEPYQGRHVQGESIKSTPTSIGPVAEYANVLEIVDTGRIAEPTVEPYCLIYS